MNKQFFIFLGIIFCCFLFVVVYIYYKPVAINCNCNEKCKKYEYKIIFGTSVNIDKAAYNLADSINKYVNNGWEVAGTVGGGGRAVGTNVTEMYGIAWNEDFVTALMRRCKEE
ncbi:MAG: hypothetical protein A2046_08800 [Bacteroidetes bacterium GWA2_30_7]|nr:MAG: hypothetical protein A2046_08800 [Bacteroidetes bacterium GWA2_30_7]